MSVNMYNNSWSGYNLRGEVHLALGDLDGNGRTDIIAGTNRGQLVIFEWNGRIFRRRFARNLNQPIQVVATGDLDNDGLDEIILGTSAGVRVGGWDGSNFVQVFRSEQIGRVTSIAVGDFNNNGRQEFAVSVGDTVYVYYFDGREYQLGAKLAFDTRVLVGAGDTTGTGRDELIVVFLDTNRISIYRWTGMQFAEVLSYKINRRITGPVSVGDVTEDFRDDIIFGTNAGSRVTVVERRAGLRHVWTSESLFARIVDFAVGDWNLDGHDELIVATLKYVFIFRWTGRTFMEVAQLRVEGTISSIVAGDVNNDGRLEIVVGTRQGNIFILRQTFQAQNQFLIAEDLIVPDNLPDIIKVAEVTVNNVRIEEIRVIPGKVIVKGKFKISVLYVGQPDRRVYEFDETVTFFHFVEAPGIGPGDRVFVDVEVQLVDTRFDPSKPREVEVIIVATVLVYDHIVRPGETLYSIAEKYNTTVEKIKQFNGLTGTQALTGPGQKLKIPF
ncbi:MAG: VCBS repeat-containing protein [Thermoanaerobacteraceae bacterium]|nr:VCBS repeat-containing protein [Thermoanaerobacteraceae bacterium]